MIPLLLLGAGSAGAQGPSTDSAALPASAPAPFNEERILGVIPDFQTITDPGHTVPPLTGRQKWKLALKETIDPFNVFTAAMGAGFSQAGNQTPKYGVGGEA